MDRRAERHSSEEQYWATIDELTHVRYSEENHKRVEELKDAGISTRTAHLLARSMEIDGPILTNPDVLKRLSDDEILSIRGMGPMSLREIREVAPQVDGEF